MLKQATYQYSDVLRDRPHEKMLAGTITAQPSKGQRNNPLKYSDIPVETKRALRKMNVRDLTRSMERAGGPTTPKGRQYAAILEERAVNPNLSSKHPQLARQVGNDMYKRAMYDAFSNELSKIASQNQPQMPAQKKNLKMKDYGFTSYGAIAPGATIGGVLGAGMGVAAGSGAAGKLAGGVIGGVLGSTIGGAYGYGQMKKTPILPDYAKSMKGPSDSY